MYYSGSPLCESSMEPVSVSTHLRNEIFTDYSKYEVCIRDVNMKIAFLIIGGKAQKAEVSLQRRLCISTSAFLKLVSVP